MKRTVGLELKVIDMRKSIPKFKVYRKDILTGEVDVFDGMDQRTVERHTGHSMAFRDHWEGGKAWERYKYIVIRKGGEWDNERKSQLFIGW